MKNINFLFLVRVLIVVAMIVASVVLYPKLPEIIPTHWGFDGQADAWGRKLYAAFIGPAISVAVLVLFPFLSKLDPKKENYKKFKGSWEILQTALVSFFGFIFILQMYFSLDGQYSYLMGRAIMAGVGVLFIVMGNLLGKIRQTYFIGFRNPWTLNDPEVWQKSHRVAGWVMVIFGIVFVFEALVWSFVIPVFIVSILSIVLIPTVYSYVISRK